jgi:hypothetical protein
VAVSEIRKGLEANIGHPPDLDLISLLYRPDDSVTPLPEVEGQHNVFRVLVDGIVVRFTEEFHSVPGYGRGQAIAGSSKVIAGERARQAVYGGRQYLGNYPALSDARFSF